MTINVGINGMGRIGRMVIRAIIENQNNMKKIGIDMINLTNEESFDITINKYFRNKWRMKN